MDGDEDDFIFFGAPIEREEDTSVRKRKAAADAGQLRALPDWKQEVRDEEGRRRFHGAFTGGFSAGYYNTVGSQEGWTPQSFTSSRKNRAEVKKQSIYSFLDEDERAELGENSLKTSSKFDTFGFTAVELARKHAEKEQNRRPSIIPGPIPDEIVLPAANSIGIKLLLKMGWRHGHSIKDAHRSLHDARREARKAFLAFSGNEEKPAETDGLDDAEFVKAEAGNIYGSQGTPEFILKPKQDLHGLGYDPFKYAPEFRDRKGSHVTKRVGNRTTSVRRRNLFSSNSGKVAPGFGIGALEAPDFEDEDIYDSGFEVEETCLEDIEQPSRASKDTKFLMYCRNKEQSLTGFKPAPADCGYKVERFLPPDIPRDFAPKHKFSTPLESASKFIDPNPPPEVSPPSDGNLRLLIEGLATLVSRCGKLFEDLSREKNKDNPLFAFLTGGQGQDYYARMVWEQQKRIDKKMLTMEMKSSSDQKMTAESRGRILGERPLEKSSTKSIHSPMQTVHFQSNLSDTFTKPACHSNAELAKPFKEDPAKQERFEQFLKDKFEGGLRSTHYGGFSGLSEADRARERLDFEAALEAMQKGESPMKDDQTSNKNVQFTAGVEKSNLTKGEEKILDKMYPKREEFQWRPAPVLCKRFDIIDPFMGKPPPLPRARSRMESLVFTSDFDKKTKIQEVPLPPKPSSLAEVIDEGQGIRITEPDEEPAGRSVQKPVDLYKAIFSDDSDDDGGGENPAGNPVDDPDKKTEGANTVLNRLVAGDFLESLGKELGLDAPMDNAYQSIRSSGAHGIEGPSILPNQDKSSSTAKAVDIAARRETFANRQAKNSGDGHKGEVGNPNACEGGATYCGDQQNGTTGIVYSRELENEMDKKIDHHKEETMLEKFRSRAKHLEENLDSKRNFPADYSFQNSSERQAKERTELPSKRHRTTSGHHFSGSSSDSDSARDRNHKKPRSHSRHRPGSKSDSESSSDEYGSRLSSKKKRNLSREKSRKHSRRHQGSESDPELSSDKYASRLSSKDKRNLSREKSRKHSKDYRGSESDTESSSDDYGSRLSSKSKRNSSRKESRKHSQNHWDKSRNYSRSHSSHRGERNLSEDEQESQKSRSHRKDIVSSRSGHMKHP